MSIDRISALTFAISSAMTGAAGVLFGVLFSSITPYIGAGIGFKAIAIVLFGGLGSLPGAVVGGLILGLVESLAVGYLATTYRDAFAFATMILILLVRPEGLLGLRLPERRIGLHFARLFPIEIQVVRVRQEYVSHCGYCNAMVTGSALVTPPTCACTAIAPPGVTPAGTTTLSW